MYYELLQAAFYAVHREKSKINIELSGTKLSMALLLYEKNNNKLLGKLKQLVPKYIKVLPYDDMTGKPFINLPSKRLLYSVDYDFKDDGGLKSTDIVFTI